MFTPASYIAILLTRMIHEDGDVGENIRGGQHVTVKEKESLLCFIKLSTAWSAGDKCFSLTAPWNPGILHPAWSHGVQLNWDSYGMDCYHKSTFEESCQKNSPSEGRCSQDKCFLQPQLPSKLSERLPYRIHQTLLGIYQCISDLVAPLGRTFIPSAMIQGRPGLI